MPQACVNRPRQPFPQQFRAWFPPGIEGSAVTGVLRAQRAVLSLSPLLLSGLPVELSLAWSCAGRRLTFLSALGTGEGLLPPAFPAVKFIWLRALAALKGGEVWISTTR